jgi:HK97 family phage major capsid protein
VDIITKLRADRDAGKKKVKAILEVASTERRNLTESETKAVDALGIELEAVAATLRAELASLEFDRTAAPAIDSAGGLPQQHAGRAANGRSFASMFGAPTASAFANGEEFFAALHRLATSGVGDPRLLEVQAAGNEAVGAEGGFSVPRPLAATWLDQGLENEIVRPRATIFPVTEGDGTKIAGWDDGSHSSGSIAGFSSRWAAELSAETLSTGKLRMLELRLLKLMTSTQCSNELLADGQGFEAQISSKMPAAVSWALDSAFISGDGAGQPAGFLNDPSLVVQTKESGQPTGTLLLENVTNMFSRLWAGGYRSGVWVCNPSVLPALYGMVAKVKNVAGTEVVGGSLAPFFFVGPNQQMTLLGLPVLTSEKMPAFSSRGDIAVCDFSQYAIALKADVTVEASRHAGWSTDSTHFRCIVRANGSSMWKEPQTQKAGPTRSPFVTLEAR